MRRDWHLIRLILLEIEAGSKANRSLEYAWDHFPHDGREDVCIYHLKLAIECGLVKQGAQKVAHLTNYGHDFVTAIRNYPVFTRVVEKLESRGISDDMSILRFCLKEHLRFCQKEQGPKQGNPDRHNF